MNGDNGEGLHRSRGRRLIYSQGLNTGYFKRLFLAYTSLLAPILALQAMCAEVIAADMANDVSHISSYRALGVDSFDMYHT